MPELIDKTSLVLLMEKHADYDSQPRACRRMVKLARNFPPEQAIPASAYDTLLNALKDAGKMTADEVKAWRKRAGIA